VYLVTSAQQQSAKEPSKKEEDARKAAAFLQAYGDGLSKGYVGKNQSP